MSREDKMNEPVLNGCVNLTINKKLVIPKLRSNVGANGSSISEYLSTIRTGNLRDLNSPAMTKSMHSTAEVNVENLLTNLTLNRIEKRVEMRDSSMTTYNIDLTAALSSPRSYKRTMYESTVNLSDSEDIVFEDLFIDCEEDASDTNIPERRLRCKTDLSEMRRYTSQLVARTRSTFGKVACVRFRPYDAPVSTFCAFTKPISDILPFDFQTLSPDDVTSLRLRMKT